MKKMLLLVGMLAVSGLAFANQATANGNGAFDVEGDVIVKAKVVESLSMEAGSTEVDFGTLLRGQANKPAVKEGQLTVIGAPESNIILSVKAPDGNYQNVSEAANGLEVNLKLNGNDRSNLLATNLKFNNNGNPIEAKAVVLDIDGKYVIDINGTATASESQGFGNYSETVRVKAQYE